MENWYRHSEMQNIMYQKRILTGQSNPSDRDKGSYLKENFIPLLKKVYCVF
jgi:hypothetical protein